MKRETASIGMLHCLLWLAVLCVGLPLPALAQTRAWLDRQQIALGDSVALTVESDRDATLDTAPLQADFEVGNQTRSRQVAWSNGAMQRTTVYGIELIPRRSGSVTVPSLQIGSERTAPLALQVVAAAPARNDGSARAFVETQLDDRAPYVQQSVGVVVRLYYAAQLAAGQLVLDTPEGASLQVVGQDRTDVREVGGRRYNVVERRYLLIPERSGALTLAGARFDGRVAGGFFEDMFGGGDGRLAARGAVQTLQVQAQPADAPQPWLPLHDLRLRYTQAPSQARTGEAVTVEVEATARGATRAQFTTLPVPALGDAAQVFAEPAQYTETFAGGSPQLKVTRRYSIVPRTAGELQVPGVQMHWWDVAAGQARVARVPDLQLKVVAGPAGNPAPPAQAIDTGAPLPGTPAPAGVIASSAAPAGPMPWPWIALAVLTVLWLATLYWGWRRGRAASGGRSEAAAAPVAADTRRGLAELKRALDHGELREAEAALCALAGVARLEQVLPRLQDARQRLALQHLQRARWAGEGELPAVRRELRAAFHDGPHWLPASAPVHTALPPLYPPH